MAKQKNITDTYVKRTLTLLRAAEGEAIAVSKSLEKINNSILKDVEKTFKGKVTAKKIATLEKTVESKMVGFYTEEFPKELVDISNEVVTKEIVWNQNLIEGVAKESVLVTRSAVVIKSAQKKKYQGKTFSRWVAKAFPDNVKAINSALKTGYLEGKSVQEMTRTITGINGKSTRDVRTITRSFFMHNAVEAKESVFNLNPDLVESKIWVSTLDSRTTPLICGVRDQLEYTLKNEPIGHSFSWDGGPGRIHWNCRSSSVPKIKGVKFTAPRTSIDAGENYKRGDNVTRTGRVRKAGKGEREKGLFDINIRTTRTKYEGWLKEQSRKNIDYVSDVLGSKDKARLFRDGKATLSDLSSLSPVANPLDRFSI